MINLYEFDNTTNYRIYLVNQGSSARNFWCFFQEPLGLPSSGVFGNSDSVLSVPPNYPGLNYFTIPYQYVLGSGASNQPVGWHSQITTSYLEAVQLEQIWEVNYVTVPPRQGPSMRLKQGEKSAPNTVGAQVNSFDQVKNENESWYGNMSFGIQSGNGYIGVVWAPSPLDNFTITPKFAFYITTGDYTSNDLEDINSIANNSAKIGLSDFQNLEVTVTLTSSGSWLVNPGKPE